MSHFSETTSYYHKETGISIRVPKQWTGKNIPPKSFRLFGEKESGFEDFFDEYRPTMSFEEIVMETGDRTGREEFVKKNDLKMATDYNNYKSVSEEWLQAGGMEIYVKHYTWTEEESKLDLSQLQAIIFVNPYCINLVNAAVLKPLEEKYMPAFDAVLRSVRIIPA